MGILSSLETGEEVNLLVHHYTVYYTYFITGPYGFVLPANQIVPNALEALDAIIAMVAEARRQNEL